MLELWSGDRAFGREAHPLVSLCTKSSDRRGLQRKPRQRYRLLVYSISSPPLSTGTFRRPCVRFSAQWQIQMSCNYAKKERDCILLRIFGLTRFFRNLMLVPSISLSRVQVDFSFNRSFSSEWIAVKAISVLGSIESLLGIKELIV